MEKPKTTWLWPAIALSLGGTLAVYLWTAGENSWRVLVELYPQYLGLAVLMIVFSWIIEALRVKVLLRMMDEDLSLAELVVNNLATAFMAGITPLAAGGPPAQTYFLCRSGIRLDKSMSAATVRLLLNFIFFVIFTPVCLLLFYRDLNLTGIMNAVVLVAVVLMASGIAAFLYFVYRPQLVQGIAGWLLELKGIKRFTRGNAESLAASVYAQVSDFNQRLTWLITSGQKARIFLLACLTVLYWLTFFSLAPVLLAGLGYRIPFDLALVRQVVYYFLMGYVPLPGASGVAEMGLASIFAALVPKGLLAGFVGGWRFLTYHLNLIFGGLAFLKLTRQEAITREETQVKKEF